MCDLAKFESAAGSAKDLPPVHLWNPDYTGDLDMRIAADGRWFYQGTPIPRARMVRLFSTLLRKDDDGRTYMVTPREKYGIVVDDAHFTIIEMKIERRGENQIIGVRTNVDERMNIDGNHPIRFRQTDAEGAVKPYVRVRGNLEALVNRAVYYDLVDAGSVERRDGTDWFGVWSAGAFWPMARATGIGFDR